MLYVSAMKMCMCVCECVLARMYNHKIAMAPAHCRKTSNEFSATFMKKKQNSNFLQNYVEGIRIEILSAPNIRSF